MNKTLSLVAAAGAVLLFAAIVLHSFRRTPPGPPRPARLEISEPAPPPAAAEPARVPEPGRAAAGPERLLPFLEKVGRARLVRDRRSQEELRRLSPAVFEEDFGWIRSRLTGELLAAAGAAELIAVFGRLEAVGDLAAGLDGHTSAML